MRANTGESYRRPAFWLLVVILGFALAFPVAGLRYDDGRDPRAVSATSVNFALTYSHPFLQGQDSDHGHKAQFRLIGNSLITALDVAAFQKQPAYEPAYPWGRLLSLLELLLTSTLFALLLLAVRRQFRR